MKVISAIIILIIAAQSAFAQRIPFVETTQQTNKWVDSVFNKMSKRDKLGQLFMIRAHSDLGKRYADSVKKVIKKEHLGGVVFFQGGPQRQAPISNDYQTIAKVPLMIAMDAEWGLGMRLDSTISYPYQMTLGAITDNSLIYKMGTLVAQDFKRLGMHINFAPVVDVNNNPKNPVINFRSFGENKFNVAEKSIAYMKGMQDEGIFTTAKHFPGHGDTDVDSHYDLPKLPFTSERLDTLEMYPFKEAFKNGLSGVMVAHMNIPSLDNTPNLPSTLSQPIVTDILKNKLGFKGLIFSDAMNMKGVVKYFPNGKADVKGILAGLDVLELSENSGNSIRMIRKAIHHNQISWKDIDIKVKKILAAKYWMGLHNYQPIQLPNLSQDLNRTESKELIQKLTDASITLLKNENPLPLRDDFVRKVGIITIGPETTTEFSKILKQQYPRSTVINISKKVTIEKAETLKTELQNFDDLIVGIYDTRTRPQSNLDYSAHLKNLINSLNNKNTTAVVFANPYAIASLPIADYKTIIVGYQNMVEVERSASKLLIGNLKATGKLPVTINKTFKYGDGLSK